MNKRQYHWTVGAVVFLVAVSGTLGVSGLRTIIKQSNEEAYSPEALTTCVAEFECEIFLYNLSNEDGFYILYADSNGNVQLGYLRAEVLPVGVKAFAAEQGNEWESVVYVQYLTTGIAFPSLRTLAAIDCAPACHLEHYRGILRYLLEGSPRSHLYQESK